MAAAGKAKLEQRTGGRTGRQLYKWREYGTGYLFMLPWVIGFGVFTAFPLGWSLYMSFHTVSFNATGFTYRFVGFDNFMRVLFEDSEYTVKMILYFQEMILIVPLIIIFSFLVSILLNQKFPGRMLLRAVFFLPVIFATGQVLLELFRQGQGELPFISQYGLEPLVANAVGKQFAEPVLNVLSQAVIILWYSGVQILIFIAGFQTIPGAIYEAVRIDGASPWESFWKITLPGMKPYIGLCTLYTLVDLFTFPFNPIMELVSKHMFKQDTGYGYSSAMAWLYFAGVLLLMLLVIWFTSRAGKERRG
ncbi:carbohydrate ABC transporter permease [Paenibacillus nasutitermitis]|uniref:Lactose ABC transporter permease n=1 Tax=Paenibacillus nasutitermitis TaxID=1652958 RepID=A0A916YRB5_9BACL|nr:sugar ABC transporter permease [Paenibacillus nasutitermitis]GGD57285.1 lactose ABC transporter permease [Paenibacillus nasutitermitis]